MITLKKDDSHETVAKLPNGSHDPKWLQTIRGIFRPIESLEQAQQRYGDIFYS